VANETNPTKLLNFGGKKDLPLILQAEATECGLACLAMIAGYYGFDTDLSRLRQRFSISSHGVTLRQLMDIAGKMHFSTRPVRAEIEALNQISMPCILHWNLTHFVVLKSIKKNQYLIHDPAFGEQLLSKEEFSKHFTGVALELSPTSSFEEKEDKNKLNLSDFWTKIFGLKRSLIHIFLLTLFLQFFGILSPLYMQIVVDDILLSKDEELLTAFAVGFALLMLIEMGTGLLRRIIMLNFSTKLDIQMSSNLFRHLIRLPMDYFYKRHMGDILSRFGALGDIRSVIASGLIAAVIDGIMMVVTLAVMLYYSATLTAIVITVVILYAFIRYLFYRPFKLLTEESIVASANESSHFMETIRAIQTIKIFQKENDRQSQWLNKFAISLNKGIGIERWSIKYDIVNGLLFGAENIAVIYIAAHLVMDNQLSIGMLFAFMSYKGRFSGSINALIDQWISLKMLDIQLTRLADIAYTKVENIDEHQYFEANSFSQSSDDGDVPEFHAGHRIKGKIEVKNLGFRYGENEDNIFSNVNFTIEPGETVAIVGPSGCGKTTLMKCLMGLLTPTEGEILIDDQPLKTITTYRSQIVGVMQDDQLLTGSISENISCFSPELSLSLVKACAKIACIHDEISKMPMHFNTLVGDMGASLSGGQKQRVILARALYRKPKILFMDEATSHLDVDNELRVSSNIRRLSITRVLVAHRPETVRSAERQISIK